MIASIKKWNVYLMFLITLNCAAAGADDMPKTQITGVEPNSYSVLVSEKKGVINTADTILLPYDIPGNHEIVYCTPPKYVKTVHKIPQKVKLSAREMISLLARLSDKKIVVEGGIPPEGNDSDNWDKKRIDLEQANYTFGALVQLLISYMQEVGIPDNNRKLWKKNNPRGGKYLIFVVVAILKEEKITLRLIITGEEEFK